MKITDIAVKRPSKEDASELIPVAVAVLIWFFLTDKSSRNARMVLIPALAGFLVWLVLKGLRYVPR